MKLWKQILSYTLCFSIVFSSISFYPLSSAQAQETPADNREVEVDPEVERAQKVEELRQTILRPELGGAELDPFDVLRQRIIDVRASNLEAIQEKMTMDDFLERKSHFESQIQTLNELENKVDEKLKVLTSDSDRFTELTLIKNDIISRRQLAYLELEDLRQFDPKTGKPLTVDFMIDKEIRTRHYWGNRLRLRIESDGHTLFDLKQEDFKNSLSPRFNKENSLESLAERRELTFSLVDPKGRVLNQFLIPVEGLFFFGQFLVFVEKGQLAKNSGHLPVRFIDLQYFKPNIGNAPLPVYTMPLNIEEAPRKISIENGNLKIGPHSVSYQQLAMLSQVQQLVYNVNVALVDPRTYQNVQPLIDEISEFLKKSMSGQDALFNERMEKALSATNYLKSMTDTLAQKPLIDSQEARPLIEEAMKDGKLSELEFTQIKKYLDADDGLKDANEAMKDAQKLSTRIQLLMQYLIQPRPQGAPKLFETLSMVAMGTQDERSRALDWAQNSLSYRMIKYGAAVGGVVLAGTFLPEPYAISLYKTTDFISAIHTHFQGYLTHIDYGRAFFHLAKDAFITSSTGWTYFFQTYLAEGTWSKFLYGLWNVLLVPIKVFGSIHLTVNSYKMLKQTIHLRKLSNRELSYLEAFKQAANQDQKAYWDSLSEAEKRVSGSDASAITPEELRLLDDHIDRLKHKREKIEVLEAEIEKGRLKHRKGESKFLKLISGFKTKQEFGEKVAEKFEKTAAEMGLKSVDTLRAALASTYLSYSALRSTFKANAITWNYLFITRSYIFSPVKWLMFLIYPNYFNVTVTTREGKQHFPSRYNGGLDLWPQRIYKGLSAGVQRTALRESKVAEKLFISAEGLSNLRAFEAYVAPMEQVAMEIAKKQAQKALIENIKDPKRIMVLFESSQNLNEPSTGIRDLHDKKIKKLTKSEKVFYRAYFTRTFDIVMQGFVSQLHGIDKDFTMDPNTFAKKVKEGVQRGEITPVKVSDAKITRIEKELMRIIDFEAIRLWSLTVGKNAQQFVDKMDIQFRHKLLESIHPGNPQIKRFLTAREKVEDPRAMERAMRMEVSSLVTSIPMGIIATLALYAGVSTGVIMPFDPEGMNTETHFRYMSKYLFYNGFIPGLLIGLMANTWMKVQQDARIDALGGFDKAIKFSDGSRGFWRYYLKNFFKNPDNKWAANHIYMLKLITANIPAAAVTIIVSNLYGLGRIDLGAFIGGYMIVYATFLTGFGVKISQAFELASTWVSNKIPRKLRASQPAQKYIGRNLQARKNLFAVYENIWSIGIEEGIAGTMLTLKDNVKYGTRAFLRMVFGGETPTQIVVHFTEKMMEAFKAVPGAKSAGEAVIKLFSNNYEAWERFPERLGLPPEGISRVVESPNLPKSPMAEGLGKLGAATVTVGTITAIPYIGAEALQKLRSDKLQKQGAQIKQERALAVIRCEQVFR